MPSLIDCTERSDSTASIWAATMGAGISCTALTLRVFCAVTAVITLAA